MTAVKQSMKPDNIRIVLVNTTHPGNIGGVARAMKNMGLQRLYLVAPRDYPNEQAVWRAASANDVLDAAVVVPTLHDAIGDCQFVVGTSARERRIPWPLMDARQCAQRMAEASGREQVAVLFIDGLNVGSYLRDTLIADKVHTQDEGILEIYRRLRPGDPPTLETAKTLFHTLFFMLFVFA